MFTHISEPAHERCLRALHESLRPGGILVLTVRPPQYLRHCALMHAVLDALGPDPLARLAEPRYLFAPHPAEPSHLQYAGGEMTYGETVITLPYIRERWAPHVRAARRGPAGGRSASGGGDAEAALTAAARPRGRSILPRADTLGWIVLAALLVGAALFLYAETRWATLWFDEWQWALDRRGNDAGAFLEPHNGHLSLVPIAIYRLLFEAAGLDIYGPYRAIVIGAHLGVVVLLFVYARRRVGPFLALLAVTLLLFLGPAWQNILWPFQVGWLISLAGGLGALLMLDRGDRAGDATASLLLALSLGCSGLGVPIALGVGVDVLWGRRRWRDAWIVGAPLALYGVWWLTYQDTDLLGALIDVPGFVADALGAAISALLGLGGETIPPRERGTLLHGVGRSR